MARNERVRAADGARTGDTLHDEIRDFASARPGGWDHDDWLTFLEHLRDRGHDTSDAAEIGSLLERERLAAALREVRGVGPRRQQALIDRFGSVWNISQADLDTVASTPGIPRALAGRIKQAIG